MRSDLLLQLADFLEQLPPERFHFGYWARWDVPGQSEDKLDLECGCSGCAGGWAGYLWPNEIRTTAVEPTPTIVDDPSIQGIDALAYFFDISCTQASYLFLPPREWPTSLHLIEKQCRLPKHATARLVATRIRTFVEANGVLPYAEAPAQS